MRTQLFTAICLSVSCVVTSAQIQGPQLVSSPDPSLPLCATASGDTRAPLITPDGRFVVFASTANNLATNAAGAAFPAQYPVPFNVFLRDRSTGVTSLVSLGRDGTNSANGNSIPTGVSNDGRYVLFESEADNLVSGDTNTATDVFLRDVVAGTTTLVSAATNGIAGNAASSDSTMTPDGRFIAFVSPASNLVPNDTNGIPDVFVRDMQTGLTVWASPGAIASGDIVSGKNGSTMPMISSDGHSVVFFSTATNLAAGTYGSGDIYIRDLVQNRTTWASAGGRTAAKAAFGITNEPCIGHAISTNGQFIAYQAGGAVLRYDQTTGVTSLISTNGAVPPAQGSYPRTLDISPDGSLVAFVENTPNVLNGTRIQIWDSSSLTVTEANTPDNGPVTVSPQFDPSGSNLAFLQGDGSFFGLFAKDLHSGRTFPAALNSGKPALLDCCATLSLTSGGRLIAFDSMSSLVSNDNNRSYDAYLADLSSVSLELLSPYASALPSLAANGSSSFSSLCASKDGKHVAFASTAEFLTSNDLNGCEDVFVRDLANGTTALASVATNGFSGNGYSGEPSLSPDGRYVAFTSRATDLTAMSINAHMNVFVRDLQSGTTRVVGVNASGMEGGNDDSYSPQIGEGGRYVLFISKATDLVDGASGTHTKNAFVRDMQANRTYALTAGGSYINAKISPNGKYVGVVPTTGTLLIWDNSIASTIFTNRLIPFSTEFGFSSDSRRVVFAYDSPQGSVNVIDLANLSSQKIDSGPYRQFSFSADGHAVAYVESLVNSNIVKLYDFVSQTQTLVTHAYDGSSLRSPVTGSPVVSAEGRFVAYRATCTNLVAGSTNYLPALYVYDRQTDSNTVLSAAGLPVLKDLPAPPVISGDGRCLFVQSLNSALLPGNFNTGYDIYAFPLFYLAVEPTANRNGVRVSWPDSAAKSYQVQYCDELASGKWLQVPGEVTRANGTASIQDTGSNASHRFYSVTEQ